MVKPFLSFTLSEGDVLVRAPGEATYSLMVSIDPIRKEYVISILRPKGVGRDLLEIVGFGGELGR